MVLEHHFKTNIYIYIYTHTCICVCVCVYIYIYIKSLSSLQLNFDFGNGLPTVRESYKWIWYLSLMNAGADKHIRFR